MCGIAGFFGDFGLQLLTDMAELLLHRGPDDFGFVFDAEHRVGLGHRRLSIIDLSDRGRQPMSDAADNAVIVYNGELYNFRELRKMLEPKGFAFRTQTDTEVLLNLFLDRGEKMFSLLNGMYAFAIWDRRDNSLLVARDGVGVKPLYYSQTRRGFLFASELKSLLQCTDIDREIDVVAVRNYLTYLWCPAPRTMLTSVQKLEPGHALLVKNGQISKKWQFYDLPYGPETVTGSTDVLAETLCEHLREAVRRQLVADVEVGAFLSGGLDSSAVVAMARQIMPSRRIPCFTIGFKDMSRSAQDGLDVDLPYAQRVAAHLDVDLRCIHVGPEMIHLLEKMIYHLDEPQPDPAAINVYLIARLARQHGIKVLLSGAGGDDIFGGYRRHLALQREAAWAWMPTIARRQLRRVACRLRTRHVTSRRLAKAFLYADESPPDRLAGYFRWARPELINSLFNISVQANLSAVELAAPLNEALKVLDPKTTRLNQMMYLEGKHFLPDHNLNYTDKMSMAAGVETRVPFLDPDLVQFAIRLPANMKQRGTQGKWLFKKAMQPYLPHDCIYRPKVGFGAPVRRWIHHELRAHVDDILLAENSATGGLFHPSAVRHLVQSDRAGQVDAAYVILGLICVELWCRLYLQTAKPFSPRISDFIRGDSHPPSL